MQYICLIYSSEAKDPQPGSAEYPTFMHGYQTFTQEMRTKGKLVHADALQPVATATTISLESGQLTVTDGPFAETKEVLGGYYLLECESLDDAIEQAAKIPTARYGRIEIRPIVVWDD